MSEFSEMMNEQGFKPVENKEGQPAVEQPEAKPEPTVEEKPVVESPIVEEPAKETAPAETPSFDFSVYGAKDEEELKAFIERGKTYESDVNEYKSKLKDYDEKSTYYTELENAVKEITENFTNMTNNDRFKLAYAAEQIAGSNRDFDSAVRVMTNDLDKMSDMDVLVLQKQFDVKGSSGDADTIKSVMLKKLGVDVKAIEAEKDGSFDMNTDLTPEQKYELKIDAASARTALNDLKANVKYQELPDPLKQVAEKSKEKEERVTTLKTQWESEAQRVANDKKLDALEYYTENEKGEKVLDFSYKIDQTFKSKIPEMVVKYATSKNMDFTQENVDKITKMLVDVYEIENRDLIRRAEVKEKISQLEKKYDDGKHNPRPFNTTDNPNPVTDPEKGLEDWVNEKLNK